MANVAVLLILLSAILFVIGLFSPKSSLFWYKKERTRKSSALIYLGIMIACFIIFGISSDSSKSNSSSSKTESSKPEEQKWTEVIVFEGNGSRKSPNFKLEGGEARIVYEYASTSGLGMGMFSVYVLDKGVDMMKEGGFPEVMVDVETDKGESSIQKSEGEYYLNVLATGKWKVKIEELK